MNPYFTTKHLPYLKVMSLRFYSREMQFVLTFIVVEVFGVDLDGGDYWQRGQSQVWWTSSLAHPLYIRVNLCHIVEDEYVININNQTSIAR